MTIPITCYDQSGQLPPKTINLNEGEATLRQKLQQREFQLSLVEKHAACVHRWLRRDDNSLLCLNCDIVKLPLAPTPMVNYQAPNESWGLGSGIDDC